MGSESRSVERPENRNEARAAERPENGREEPRPDGGRAAADGSERTAPSRERLPEVPEAAIDEAGFDPVEVRRVHRADLPTGRVVEQTRVYEDRGLRERVRAATGVDLSLRFLVVAAIDFEPALPPLGIASLLPTVAREARQGFRDELERRGVRALSRAGRERLRLGGRDRLRLTGYRGQVAVGDERIDAAGWVGVRSDGDGFRLVGGGHPETLPAGVEAERARDRAVLVETLREAAR